MGDENCSISIDILGSPQDTFMEFPCIIYELYYGANEKS